MLSFNKIGQRRYERPGIRENLRSPEQRVGTLLVLVAALGVAAMFALMAVLFFQVPSVDQLQDAKVMEASIVYTADGEEITRYSDENRTWIPLDSMSAFVPQALIATEDKRFYEHSGVDVQRTIGSVFKTIGGDRQGGSTITMQLARNAFSDIQDDFAYTRKFKEWLTALRLEDMYEKDQILEMYLNTVPFMYNAFGIEAAAETYFQKPALDLTIEEAATLVGMLKGTVFYNPVRNPERSQERRNVVLEQMTKSGYLSQKDFARLRDRPTKLRFRRLSRTDNLAPFFAEYLRQYLGEWAEERGYNLYRDGLRIHTTLDSKMQQAAQEAVVTMGDRYQAVGAVEWSRRQSPYFSSNSADYVSYEKNVSPFAYFWDSNPRIVASYVKQSERYRKAVEAGEAPQAALDRLQGDAAFMDSLKAKESRLEVGFVALDPRTGQVRAWVGGRSFEDEQYDHVALAKRQPGSTFKPFVYTAAIDNGFSPEDEFRDEVIEYVDPDTKRRWRPTNVGSSTGQLLTLRDALAYSKNTVTAQLVQEVGPGRVADYAHRMGIQSDLDAVPSIGLGTSDVSLLEMASAYGTLANGGNYIEPIVVTRIEDRTGKVLATFSPDPENVISASTAYTVLDMMRGVVDYGTGQRIRSVFGMRGDLAGKTGTTQNGADGWFMLVHPDLVMASWIGFSRPALTFRSSYWGQGSHNALYVVGNFVKAIDLPQASFEAPPGYVAPAPSLPMQNADYYSSPEYLDSLQRVGDSLAGDRWAYDRWDYTPQDEVDWENGDDEVSDEERAPSDSLNRRRATPKLPDAAFDDEEQVAVETPQTPDRAGQETSAPEPANAQDAQDDGLTEIERLNRQQPDLPPVPDGP